MAGKRSLPARLGLPARIGLWLVLLAGELAALKYYGGVFWAHIAHPPFTMPSDLACFRMHAALAQGIVLPPAQLAGAACAYMYPPPFLLLTAPLPWMGPGAAYAAWSIFGAALLALGARAAKFSWRAIALGLVSPPGLFCLMAGQTGEVISGLLLLALALPGRAPVPAGIAAACVIVKPQFAVLLPVCFLAARNWRLMGSAALTAVLLCLLSLAAFGAEPWRQFLFHGVAAAHARLGWAWPDKSQTIELSPFIMFRSLGAGVNSSYMLQGAVTLCTVIAAWRLWRPEAGTAPGPRAGLSLCLVALASPYGYIYDIPGIAAALAALVLAGADDLLALLAVLWLITGFYIFISALSFVTGALYLAILAIALRAHAPANRTKVFEKGAGRCFFKNVPSRQTAGRGGWDE